VLSLRLLLPAPLSANIAMGAQPTKVQSSLQVLRGTPVEVWSKSEGRWIAAVIGAPKDVREPPPESSAVLVLFKEVVGGRSDAFKWVKADDIPELIRARPEAKQQAGMMDSVASPNFNTMYEHRSAFEKRGVEPQQHSHTMQPIAEAGYQSHTEQPSGVMSSFMASFTGSALPASAMASMAPSMASTIDQNASRLDPRQPMHPMGSMMQTIDQNASRLDPHQPTYPMGSMMGSMMSVPEERPSFMSSMMGGQGTTPHYDPNVHMPTMAQTMPPADPQAGIMASLMGMGGSLPPSMMGSQNGSMTSMTSMAYGGENTSPNRTPMGSMNGKMQPSMQPHAQNPMSSFMSSMGFNMEPESKAATMPATMRRGARM